MYKVALKVAILGYFMFSKPHNELSKVAKLAENDKSGHPVTKHTSDCL
jgi:hypothetical protein